MPLTCCDTLSETAEGLSREETTNCDESGDWFEIPGAIVELKSADKGKCNKVIDETTADDNGYYLFEDVNPGLYIITAKCPVEGNEGFLTKDVAEKFSGVALDAGVPDCTSAALALVIEKINNCYNDWYQCFGKLTASKIYNKVEDIADAIGTVDIPAIKAHADFGNYCEGGDEDLVDLICAWSCCVGPGVTDGGGGNGPPPGPTTYTVTYNGNENTGGTAPIDPDSPYTAGSTVTVLGEGDLEKTGYSFVEWDTASDGSGDAYSEGETFSMPGDNVTLYAQWEANTYTVTFYDCDGTQYGSTQSLNYGDLVTKPTDPTKTGYTFKGWYEEDTFVNEWDFANDTVTGDLDLYAKCVADTYTVTFYDCDGEYLSEAEVAYGDLVTEPADPTGTGYSLDGWYTEPTFVTEWDFANDTVTGDLDLYAKCVADTYTVTFYDCDGEYLSEAEVAYGDLVTEPADPTGTGYSLDGWYTEPTFVTEWDFANDTVTGDLDLYAKCVCDPCNPDNWSAVVDVYKYWKEDTSGSSYPQIQVVGSIYYNSECLLSDENISTEVRIIIMNNGGNNRAETESKDFSIPEDNPFNDIFGRGTGNNWDQHYYSSGTLNSAAKYELQVKPEGCIDWIVIDSGELINGQFQGGE
jgi:uncharacterized repeat protein (TIGR02543 family)